MLLLISVLLSSCKKEPVTRQGFFFDTVVNITVNDGHADKIDQAFSLCDDLENVFSRTKQNSELYNLNQKKECNPSSHLKKVLEFSSEMSVLSDGAFDITVAPLTDLWNVKERTTPPSEEDIHEALSQVGYEKLSLSPLNLHDTTLDLGAIAKGYAADVICQNFRESGVESAIIDLGGNVALIGEFTVGIRDPFNPDNLYARITVKDKSAVTSGAYQRYFEHEGKRYHHITDPRTGYCAESGLSSVTVISPSSMQADALSTAIFVLGKSAVSLCDNFPDTDAFLITENGEIITTEGFNEKYSPVILKH